MKKILNFLFHRITIIAVILILQLLVIIGFIRGLDEYFYFYYVVSIIISLIISLYIINARSNPSYKIVWLLFVLVLPFFGWIMYFLFANTHTRGKIRKALSDTTRARIKEVALGDDMRTLEGESLSAAAQSRYITHTSDIPVTMGNECIYFGEGADAFQAMLTELEKAEKYIFIEYFIISEGKMWNTILEILKRKASEGIDVRVIYDDLGCSFRLPSKYDKTLLSMGIKCCVFNKFIPILSSRFNTRSHRKNLIIDGKACFTGGINLADEYINEINRYGHWKDNAILVKGEAAWGMTVSFLQFWHSMEKEQRSFSSYRPESFDSENASGFVQPFVDNPLDDENVGRNIYMNMITRAKKRILISTPYLVMDSEMSTSLINAAKSGIDVKICTPSKNDSWYVHAVARADYAFLIENGVEIYEYSPGFIHSKAITVDGEYAVVSTVNFDYRSFYFHFECGMWIYKNSCVADIENDLAGAIAVSERITPAWCEQAGFFTRLGRALLKVFAPLM